MSCLPLTPRLASLCLRCHLVHSLTDGQALVLGTRFTAGVDGSITAFRYFRAADETAGTHVGNLFLASTGELLASTGR